MNKFMLRAFGAILLTLLATAPALWAEEEDFGGPEIAYEQPVKGVFFSHKTHVGDYGFSCDSCHDGIFDMMVGAAYENGDFTMDSLYQGKYCGACHDGSMAFAANTQCASCHVQDGGDVIYTEPVKGVLFSHDVHGQVGLDCASCHDGLFEMRSLAAQENANFVMEALYEGEYCGACHDGSMAFASDTQCATCHIGVKGLRRATGSATKEQAAH